MLREAKNYVKTALGKNEPFMIGFELGSKIIPDAVVFVGGVLVGIARVLWGPFGTIYAAAKKKVNK